MKTFLQVLIVAAVLAGCGQAGWLPPDNSDGVEIKHRIPSK